MAPGAGGDQVHLLGSSKEKSVAIYFIPDKAAPKFNFCVVS